MSPGAARATLSKRRVYLTAKLETQPTNRFLSEELAALDFVIGMLNALAPPDPETQARRAEAIAHRTEKAREHLAKCSCERCPVHGKAAAQ
jgi:hypothetical protein